MHFGMKFNPFVRDLRLTDITFVYNCMNYYYLYYHYDIFIPGRKNG